ncbi:ABC transporter ATP-binding protein [Alteromonas sp. BMJM2]|uniref:ABC transporter ATP-binding protein n=1 Tax=Alteromonas sp. BMJM2 TaxID=2954241 RepID=UPI0022B47BFE|nr:ABC transporter ATP-binding protein [Alteromonas sp. BMJM2]
MQKSVPRTLINLQNVSKSFVSGKVSYHAVRNANLQITEGDMASIRGTSGSGKTTLLSIIGLLEELTDGQYGLCDFPTTQLKEKQLSILRNKNIGWVFQNFNLINDLTVAQNVCAPLRYNKSLSSKAYTALVTDALIEVGMLEKANAFPSQLSGGQQQRVAIARAIINKPDIILADEPTGNLDKENSGKVMSLLQRLNDSGATILVVTHDLDIANMFPIQYRMDDGTLSRLHVKAP